LTTGTRLGPYHVLGLLGAGGMGEVYKARDIRLDRTVAIKVLSREFAADGGRRERFEREARAVAGLNHPNICDLHDVGEAPDPESPGSHAASIPFLVMEYLEGQALADRLVRGPLPIHDVLRHAIELASALDHAHRQGLVHRDLKPANVMLTKEGAKLLDFGLAKLRPTPDLISLPTISPEDPLTAEKVLLGTFPYMSPEQLAGRETDARSDLFAFGAMLYEMASGRRAFEGSTTATLIGAILHTDPPPLSSVEPRTPLALDRVVSRCLAKDPETRWQTARDLMLELKWIAEHEQQSPRAAARPVRKTWKVGLLAVAALALLATAVAAFNVAYARRGPTGAAMTRLTFPTPEGLTLADLDVGGPVVISPDGRQLAFVATGQDGRQLLWVRPLESLEARALPETDGAALPFWSPDSRFIGFFSQGKLKKIQIGGPAPQTLCDATLPRGGTWSRHGEILFAANIGRALYRIPAAGGVAVPVPADGFNAERKWPVFLPDGRHFVYFARPQETGIFVAALDSSKARLLLSDYVSVDYAPGYLLVLAGSSKSTRAGTLMAHPFDPARLELIAEPSPVAERIEYVDGIGRGAFSVSENGTLVYANMKMPTTRLTWFDRDGRSIGTVGEPAAYSAPSLSPDDVTVAVERLDLETRASDLWLIDTARGVSSRFTSDLAGDWKATWSPQGDRIVFASPRGSPPNLYEKHVSGSGMEERLITSADNSQPSDWSRDGRFLAYASQHPDRKWDLWLLPMSTAPETDRKPVAYLLSESNENLGQFSPDGRWLAYVSDASGINEVYVGTLPKFTFARQISANGGSRPRWRANGRELFYVAADGMLMAVNVKPGEMFEASAPVALFKTGIQRAGASGSYVYTLDYAVASDGQRFLISTAIGQPNAAPTNVFLNWTAALNPR
jgi:Tol biopolymer transport system component